MTVLQLETPVGGGKASIGAEMCECRDEPLIDVERGKLVQFFEKVGPLRHYLRQQRKYLRGALPYQRAELTAAEKHGLRLFTRAGVRDVVAVGRETFATEGLTSGRDDGNKAASYFDLVAKYYVPVENDEDTVGHGAALIKLESRGPDGSRAIRADRGYLFWSEARAPHSSSRSFHLALVIPDLAVQGLHRNVRARNK